MLKNKFRIIAILMMILLVLSAPFVKADNETTSSNDTITEPDIMPISDDPDQPSSENTTDSSDYTAYEEDSLESSESIDSEDNLKKGDVYLTGDNIVVDYIVDGNLFIIANNVTITSQIGGDAFICANSINIEEESYIFSNLFTVCKNLDIKGVVYDVYALSDSINVSGYIYRDLRSSCKNLTISGTVARNAYVNVDTINFVNSTEDTNTSDSNNAIGFVDGDLNYFAKQDLNISPDNVSGNIIYTKTDSKSTSSSIQDTLISIGTLIATSILIWLLLLWLAPKFVKDTANIFSKKILPILGVGLLGLIILPIIVLILLLLGITANFALLLLALYFMIIGISTSVFIIVLNNFICSKLKISKNIGIFGMLIATSLIIGLLSLIPYLGTIIIFISILIGIGYSITSIIPKNKTIKEPSAKAE